MRRLSVIVIAAALVVGGAMGASAHEEINPKTTTVGQPTFLELSTANEKKVGLTKVTVHAPDGLPFGATTRSPAGWHAEVSPTVLSWAGGSVAPNAFEMWGFEIEGADQAKTYTYKVDLGFADGSTDSVEVPLTAIASVGTTPTSTAKAAVGSNATKKTDAPARVVSVVALLLSLFALRIGYRRRSRRGGSGGDPAAADNDW